MTAALTPLQGKELATEVHAFLASRFGKHYVTQLSYQYNALHQEAEQPDLTSEKKAMKVERAAGLKLAIDYLTSRDQLLAEGFYDKKPNSVD